MEDLDQGAFDKPQLDQPPLEFGSREAVVAVLDANHPNPPGRPDRGSAERYRILQFTSRNARAPSIWVGASYCDSLSVASRRPHSWYRITCESANDVGPVIYVLHAGCNVRLFRESAAAASAANLQRDFSLRLHRVLRSKKAHPRTGISREYAISRRQFSGR